MYSTAAWYLQLPSKARLCAPGVRFSWNICFALIGTYEYMKYFWRSLAIIGVLFYCFFPVNTSPDFRHYVTPPYLMVTTLRNPLELFVSSQQFSHRDETSTLPDAVDFVSAEMRKRIG